MAGFGNKTNPELNPEDLREHHDSTRLGREDSHAYSGGHETYGSGATGGVGFGNKTNVGSDEPYDNSDIRFGSHQNSDPYTGHGDHPAGSGTVGGAGYGNKTGSHTESHDSTMGKLMEKAGHMMKKENLVEKGRAKREAEGYGKEEGESHLSNLE